MKTIAAILLLLGVAATQTEVPSVQEPLQQGIAAYKRYAFGEAEQYLLRALQNDPKSLNAHLYLAMVYADQYIPGSENVDNLALLHHATDEFAAVLEFDPQNLQALKALGKLSFHVRNYEMSRRYHTRVTELDPHDATAFYMLGIMDWIESYEPRMKMRARLGIEPAGTLYDKPRCQELRAQNWDRVNRGMKMITEAIRLDPDYDDAMAYLNLLYRERADIQCGSEAASLADQRAADDWVDLTLKTKRDKAFKAGHKDLRK